MTKEMTTVDTSATALMLNETAMVAMDRLACAMASSAITIPQHLRGNQSDCLAVVMQAAQWGMNPFAVAQKTHVVSGTLGYESQLVNAVISSSSAITGRFKYEYRNWQPAKMTIKPKNGNSFQVDTEDGQVRVGAILNGDSEITWGEWIDTRLVKIKNSPLWQTNPKQQAAYLALKYWARLYTPEVIMGVYDHESLEASEIANSDRVERDITPHAEHAENATLSRLAGQQDEQRTVEPDAVERSPEPQPEPVGANEQEGMCTEASELMDKATTLQELQEVFSKYWRKLSGHKEWQGTLQQLYEDCKSKF